MCGICGFTGKPNNRLIEKMNDTLKHRGPEDDGFYIDKNVSMGMRRLSIIDLTTGKQPITNEDKSIWIVLNGEIYNFLELKKELKKSGHKFSTKSDTEIIIHLYEEYGLNFPKKLNGMFAIAIWDSSKQKLILVRDRMGVKPLYYFFNNKEIVFGSEIKAILAGDFYKKSIDFESLHHFLSLKHVPAPKTIFKNIFTILPGEMLIFKDGKIKKNKYWKPEFKENCSLTEKEIKKKILNLLNDSVKLRMRSDVPVGAYLSGGLDSSSIVALMTRFTNKPINTFCLGYEDDFKNKSADFYAARKIAKIYKTNHHEYIMSWKEIPKQINNIIKAFDEPFGGVISTFFLSQLIKKHVKVALSGDGADELFGSYLSHRLAQPMVDYVKLKKNNQNIEKILNKLNLNEGDKEIFLKIFDKDVWNWRAKLLVFNEKEKKHLYSPKLKNKTREFNSINLFKKYFKKTTTKDPLNRILEVEFKTIFPDQVLAFADRLSMAHSIELRSPFLDYRFVEFVNTIPGNLKIKNGAVKSILKESVWDLLPQEIINRPKEGFVLPINQWLFKNMEGYVKKVLSSKRLRLHGFFNEIFVKNLIECYYTNQQLENSNKIWNLIMFQLWWEKYFY
ncbi:asparagine synthase (glutamine-hydrolyzing) [Patescibacteria group bacterium]|nr:asparagine synthase (glutamine-hydrolyzing) [Patescibacteria group bacterium]